MEIRDGRGRMVDEVVLRLSPEEMADLLVATSQVDDGSADHVVLRDRQGSVLAIYPEGDDKPLEHGSDWWVGPILLLVIVLLVIGAFSVARSLVGLLF